MLDKIIINRKTFIKYIDETEIRQIVDKLAEKITKDYENESISFIVVLNGAFIFAADLIRSVKNENIVHFVKISSYSGTTSQGIKAAEIPIITDFNNKNVIIIEDIIETGLTIDFLVEKIRKSNPKSLQIATLLYKPLAFKSNYDVLYIGKQITNEFVVGYGMDFNQSGRGLANIYQAMD